MQQIDINELPKILAIKYAKRTPVEYDDLLQEGRIGLLESETKFDPSKGKKYINFAYDCIKRRILKYLATKSRIIRLPDDIYFQKECIHKCKDGNIKVRKAFSDASAIYIEKKGGDVNILDTLSHEDESYLKIEKDFDNKKEVEKLLSLLTPRQRLIVSLFFGIGQEKDLKESEIGVILGTSRQNISEIIQRSLKRIKKKLERGLK